MKIEGLSIGEVERLFTPIPTNEELIAKVNELNRKLFKKEKLSKQITINSKSFAAVDMGIYTIPDGYDFLGIIPFSS